MSITVSELMKIKRALIKANQSIAGLTEGELIAAYDELNPSEPAASQPAPIVIEEDKPSFTAEEIEEIIAVNPKPEPITKPKTKKPALKSVQAQDALQPLRDLLGAGGGLVDEARIVELINEHSVKPDILVIQSHSAPDITIEGGHNQLAEVVDWLSTGTNVYCTGPAGSGKTTLAEMAAKSLSLDFYSKGACMAAYELVGTLDANGNYNPTDLYKCWTEGGLMLLDEIDGYSPRALVALNALLGNDLFSFPNGMQKKHDKCVFIASANTIGLGATRQYIGRAQLDAATLDRFIQVDIDYCPVLELSLARKEYAKFGGTNEAVLISWVDTVQAVRKELATMGSTAIVSPRASQFGARGLAIGKDRKVLIKQIITKHLSEDQISQLRAV